MTFDTIEAAREHLFNWLGVCRVFGDEIIWFGEDVEGKGRIHFAEQDKFEDYVNRLIVCGAILEKTVTLSKAHLKEFDGSQGVLMVFKVATENLFNEDLELPTETAAIFNYKQAGDEIVMAKVIFNKNS